jgi:hypothetical protein
VGWDVYKTSRSNGEVVPANGEISMFSVKRTDQTRALAAIIGNLDDSVCYCPVLQERWSYSRDNGRHRGECAVDRASEFAN